MCSVSSVLFLAELIQIAACKAALRVQSERSERLRELHEVQGSRELAPWRGRGCPVDTSQPQAEKRRPSRQARPGASRPGQVWGAGVQWTPLSRRLRSADRAGRRDPAAQERGVMATIGRSGRLPKVRQMLRGWLPCSRSFRARPVLQRQGDSLRLW